LVLLRFHVPEYDPLAKVIVAPSVALDMAVEGSEPEVQFQVSPDPVQADQTYEGVSSSIRSMIIFLMDSP
jgi:hypothetical protein